MNKIKLSSLTSYEKRLAIADFLGGSRENHSRWKSDDCNRSFFCEACMIRQTWPEYVLVDYNHPVGKCAGTNKNYLESEVWAFELIRYLRNGEDYWICLIDNCEDNYWVMFRRNGKSHVAFDWDICVAICDAFLLTTDKFEP